MKRFAVMAIIFGFFLTFKASLFAQSTSGQSVPVKCQSSFKVEEYITPACPGRNPGDSCPPITSTARGDTYDAECLIQNQVVYVDPNVIKQVSGSNSFIYRLDGGMIKFMQDTVWGGDVAPFLCEGSGKNAMYRVFNGSPANGCDIKTADWGAEHIDTNVACGGITEKNPSYLCAYAKPNPLSLIEQDYKYPVENCSVKGQSGIQTGGSNQLFFQGKVKCCGEPINVIGVVNLAGPGEGEVYFYCEGRGLCAQYQSLVFEGANDPTTWNENTDVCKLKRAASQAPYYLYPIPGLAQGGSETIASELVNQGYQVSCNTPKITISAQKGGLYEYVPPGTTLTLEPILQSDYSTARTPIWRDATRKTMLEGSLETFWGFQNLTEETKLARDIASAPIYTLTTLRDQCKLKYKMLNTIKNMCNKLENPDACALYQTVPETEYTTKSLLEVMDNGGITCDLLFGSETTSPTSNQSLDKIKIAIINVPLYLDKAYRLAFLVMTIEVKNPGPTSFFNFMLKEKPDPQYKHEVKVIAFKIPDFMTNKDRDSDIFYQDPTQLTKDVLQSHNIQLKQYELFTRLKRTLLALVGKISGIIAPPISCGSSCGTPLVQALVDIVNANGRSCLSNPEDLPYEQVNVIKDEAGLASGSGVVFKPPEGDIVNTMKDAHQVSHTQTFNFMAKINLTADGDSQSQIVSYLVYPIGYDQEDVENTLIGYAYGINSIDSFKGDEANLKLYKLSDISQTFSEAKAWTRAFPPPEHPCWLDDSCKAEATIVTDPKINIEPRVTGGWFGTITRKIQQLVNPEDSEANNYAESCTTIEKFLLGQCPGSEETGDVENEDTTPDSSPNPTSGGDYCIDWKMENMGADQKQQLLAAIDNYMTTNSKVINFSSPNEHPLESGYQFWTGSSWLNDPPLTNFYENWVNGGRSKLFFKMPAGDDECGDEICYKYVANECFNAGFNPIMCVVMNLTETAGSNTRYNANDDFGCSVKQVNSATGENLQQSNVKDGLHCLIDHFFKREAVLPLNFTGMWNEFAGLGTESSSYKKFEEYYLDISGGLGYTKGACQ